LTGSTDGSLSVATGLNGDDATTRVLEDIKHELVALLGGDLDPGTIRVDVDVFEGTEPLIAGRWLDSMGLVQVIAALEDRFGVRLAAVLTGDEPMTLANVARHIAQAQP
jgi:acyl carrier protein